MLLKTVFLALLSPLVAANVSSITHHSGSDTSLVEIDLAEKSTHRIFNLDNPSRVVVDLGSARITSDTRITKNASDRLSNIRHSNNPDGSSRIVLDTKPGVKVKSYWRDDNLVIDVSEPSSKKLVSVQQSASDYKKRKLVITIDAGHGGKDPGAIGPRGLREKDVVLSIAQKLKKLFDRNDDYTVVMVRDGDKFVDLWKRRDIGRTASSDLFVSIHADAFTNPQANGASVYTVTHKAASSAMAKFLAASSNKSLVGGITLGDKDPMLSQVLSQMSMDASMQTARMIGTEILPEIAQLARLHSKTVESAPFAVLKAPDVPSILIETGFISNPKESRKLGNVRYQEKMARAIYRGIDGYFKKHPPYYTGSTVNQTAKSPARPITRPKPKVSEDGLHHVVSGDTLWGIARAYRISVSDLRKMNNLQKDSLSLGQVLRVK